MMASRVALLDVNVLVPLFDQNHIHHEAAHQWFQANRHAGWATCPLTENGLVRILSNASYPSGYEGPDLVRQRLQAFCSSSQHSFWPDSLSLLHPRFDLSAVTSSQLTDVYLLALAVEHGGRLATFDRRIPSGAVARVDRNTLEVIPA